MRRSQKEKNTLPENEQRKVLLDSINVAKNELDRINFEYSEQEKAISKLKVTITKLKKQENDLVSSNKELSEMEDSKECCIWEKRREIADLNTELKKINDNFIQDKDRIDQEFNSLSNELAKRKESLVKNIKKLEQEKMLLEKDNSELRDISSNMQKQKDELFLSLTKDKDDLNILNSQIFNLKKDIERSEERNISIKEENIRLSVEAEKKQEELSILNKKYESQSETLAKINEEISEKWDELDQIKQDKLTLIRREEEVKTKGEKIKEYYRKAGITIKDI